jgi:hypothetical protein
MTTQTRHSSTALLVAISFIGSSAIPFFSATAAFAQTTFNDVPTNYWAQTFIQELATRDIIKGFPDGGFRPNDPVTRAQFAAMLNKAINKAPIRGGMTFVDVDSNYWAASAIEKSYTTGFLSGYPGNVFEPSQNIPRVCGADFWEMVGLDYELLKLHVKQMVLKIQSAYMEIQRKTLL